MMIEFMIDEASVVTHVTLNHDNYKMGAEIHRFFQQLGIGISMYYVDSPTRKGREEIIRAARYLNEYHDNIARFKREGWVQS